MSAKRVLVLCVAVPLLLALFNGVRGSIWAPNLGLAKTFVMFAACGVPLWLVSAGVAQLLLRIVRKAGGHPILALAGTLVFSVPFSYFVILAFINLFAGAFPGLESALQPDGRSLVGGLLGYLSGPRSLLFVPLWLASHWLYEIVTGEIVFYRGFVHPRKAADDVMPAAASSGPHPDPEFVKKLRPELGRNILALEAQEHYIKVHTDLGHELIHYRFGDAVQELANKPGLQVHRSYWVADDAVVAIVPVGKSYRLTLRNGLTVPVSLSYRGALQQHRILNAPLPRARLGLVDSDLARPILNDASRPRPLHEAAPKKKTSHINGLALHFKS
jgi:hypothetical protein